VRNDATTIRARLCTKPLGLQLAHRRVDDGEAGAAVFPGLHRVGVVAPPVAAVDVVGPRGVGPRREDLRVEVTPAQLADEGVDSLALVVARGPQHLERRHAPEVQVRRQA